MSISRSDHIRCSAHDEAIITLFLSDVGFHACKLINVYLISKSDVSLVAEHTYLLSG